jgi:hypothetical protein
MYPYPTTDIDTGQPAARPVYRRPAVLAAAAAAALAIALGLSLWLAGLFTGPAQTPAGILRADGYTVTASQTVDQAAAAGELNSSMGKQLKPYIVAIAAGTHGAAGEGVIQLTGAGRAMFAGIMPLLTGQMGAGVTAHMAGDFLVLDGPAGQLGSIGSM